MRHKHHNRSRFFKFIPGVIAVFAAFTAITMLLWNALMPAIFGLTAITFWQALGLMILARLLFGGVKTHQFWKHKRPDGNFRRKWMNLSPEERKAFIMKRYFDERDEESTQTNQE